MKRRSLAANSSSGARSDSGEQGFWPSYADMMSSFALILFFLMLLSYIQNLITGNDLQNTQEVLSDTKAQLQLTEQEVEDATDALAKIQIDLDDANEELKGKQKDLMTQQALIDSQQEYLAAANEEISQMRSQMQTIAVLRLSILEQIKDSIVRATGDSSKVSIGDNGNIILNEGILFDTGSYQIKPEAQSALDQLGRVFREFLADENNAKYIDSIVISGHTDTDGTPDTNRTLSTNRANSVLNYLLNTGLSSYSSYFCAAGYGQDRPVASNNTEEGKAQNRRIEISIILKDDTVLEIVDEYLNIDVPDTPKAAGKDDGNKTAVTGKVPAAGGHNSFT